MFIVYLYLNVFHRIQHSVCIVYTIGGISLGQYRTICQCQKTIMRCMAVLQLNITRRNHYMQLCAPVIMIGCAACNELSGRMRRQLRKLPESGISLLFHSFNESFIKRINLLFHSFIKRRNLAACVSKWAPSISNVCKLAALCLQQKKQRRPLYCQKVNSRKWQPPNNQ